MVIFFVLPFISLNAYSTEDNPSACDCKTIVISDQELQNGCPASVKREACPLFRESEQWQQKLQKQQEMKNMEDRMNPGRTGAYPHH